MIIESCAAIERDWYAPVEPVVVAQILSSDFASDLQGLCTHQGLSVRSFLEVFIERNSLTIVSSEKGNAEAPDDRGVSKGEPRIGPSASNGMNSAGPG